jgi:hypothetical protein
MKRRITRSVLVGLVAAVVAAFGIGLGPSPAAAAPVAHNKIGQAHPAHSTAKKAATVTKTTATKVKIAKPDKPGKPAADTGKHKKASATSVLERVAYQAAFDAVARTLKLTRGQLQSSLKRGQTLAQLETAHGVSDAQVQAAALAAGKAALTAGVQRKAWTQAQATAYAAVFEKNLAAYLAALSQHKVKK